MYFLSIVLPALLLLNSALALAQEQPKAVRDWGDGVKQNIGSGGVQTCTFSKSRVSPPSGFGFSAGDTDDGPLALVYVELRANLSGGAVTFQIDNNPPIHSDANASSDPGAAYIALTDRAAIDTLAKQLFVAHTIRVATKAGLRSFPAGPDVFRGFLTMMMCKSYIVGFADGKQAATKSK